MTTSVTHRTGGGVDAQNGQYGQTQYGWYASGGNVPADLLAVSHRADGQTSVTHRSDGTTAVKHR